MGNENKPTAGKAAACFAAALIWSMPLWQSIGEWKFGWWDLLPLGFVVLFVVLGSIVLVKYFREKNR